MVIFLVVVTPLVYHQDQVVPHLVTQKCSCEHWPKGAKSCLVEIQKINDSLVVKNDLQSI